MSWYIRSMQLTDITAVVAIQNQSYGAALYEPASVLMQRLQQAATSCWVAEDASSQQVLGYLFSYHSVLGEVGELGAEFTVIPDADALYLHDVAISPLARGKGIAQGLLRQAHHYANKQQLLQLTLVAVQGATSYWQRQGFHVVSKLDKSANDALASYDIEKAIYMAKQCSLL